MHETFSFHWTAAPILALARLRSPHVFLRLKRLSFSVLLANVLAEHLLKGITRFVMLRLTLQ